MSQRIHGIVTHSYGAHGAMLVSVCARHAAELDAVAAHVAASQMRPASERATYCGVHHGAHHGYCHHPSHWDDDDDVA